MPYMHKQLYVQKCVNQGHKQAMSNRNVGAVFTAISIQVCWEPRCRALIVCTKANPWRCIILPAYLDRVCQGMDTVYAILLKCGERFLHNATAIAINVSNTVVPCYRSVFWGGRGASVRHKLGRLVPCRSMRVSIHTVGKE